MNWKVRIRNKMFWLAIIPALLILVNTILSIFNIELNFESLEDRLLALVEAVFTVMAILGIVTDPTTEGIGDSQRAMLYEEPYNDNEIEEVHSLEELGLIDDVTVESEE